jgi:putative ABC transport system substrate-binding protein
MRLDPVGRADPPAAALLLLHLAGVPLANTSLRNIGIIGYAAPFPVANSALMRFRAAALVMFLSGVPLAADAQSAGNVPTVGYFLPGPPQCRLAPRDEAFYQGLRDLGHIPGKNITVDRRCFRTSDEMRSLLREFVNRKVDVIFVGAPALAMAARAATTEIPIVCGSCGDPLENGLVASLARPGGNVTGLASQSAELIGKRVELLKAASPRVARIAALLNPDNPGTRLTVKALDDAGRALDLEIQRVEFRNVGELDQAFRSAATGGATALLIQDDPHALAARVQIAEFAVKHRLPAVAGVPEYAEAGGLIAYGPNRVALYRRAATFVDKILKGAKPGDLPIEQPTQYDLIINLKTAEAIGVTMPSSLLSQANRVIR